MVYLAGHTFTLEALSLRDSLCLWELQIRSLAIFPLPVFTGLDTSDRGAAASKTSDLDDALTSTSTTSPSRASTTTTLTSTFTATYYGNLALQVPMSTSRSALTPHPPNRSGLDKGSPNLGVRGSAESHPNVCVAGCRRVDTNALILSGDFKSTCP